jgi:hypothetical protein
MNEVDTEFRPNPYLIVEEYEAGELVTSKGKTIRYASGAKLVDEEGRIYHISTDAETARKAIPIVAKRVRKGRKRQSNYYKDKLKKPHSN